MKGNSKLERRIQRAGRGRLLLPEAANPAPSRQLNGSPKRPVEKLSSSFITERQSRSGRDSAVKRNGYRS